jgi:hypothetical protein
MDLKPAIEKGFKEGKQKGDGVDTMWWRHDRRLAHVLRGCT